MILSQYILIRFPEKIHFFFIEVVWRKCMAKFKYDMQNVYTIQMHHITHPEYAHTYSHSTIACVHTCTHARSYYVYAFNFSRSPNRLRFISCLLARVSIFTTLRFYQLFVAVIEQLLFSVLCIHIYKKNIHCKHHRCICAKHT